MRGLSRFPARMESNGSAALLPPPASRRAFPLVLAALAGLAAALTGVALSANTDGSRSPTGVEARVAEAYGKLQLAFEPNRGQSDPRVKFLARGSGYSMFLTPTEAVLSLRRDSGKTGDGAVLRMKLLGSNPDPAVSGQSALAGRVNYMRGNRQERWQTNIPTYGKVAYADVYPGVDLVYYGNQRHLEYDFVVAPRANPDAIKLGFRGAQSASVTAGGDLLLRMPGGGTVRQSRPIVYQRIDGERHTVSGRYVLEGNRVGFALGAYDRSRPLVIDPTLAYSTYLGGTGTDYGLSVAVDRSGNAYVTGGTSASNFPTTAGAFRAADPDPADDDAFVTKLNQRGSALVYSTYLGGTGFDNGYIIAIDGNGSAYVSGPTSASDFPTTPGSFQPADPDPTDDDAFVTKLNQRGSGLVYSTYLGGIGLEESLGIVIDGNGSAYVSGRTAANNFPTTPGSFQAGDPDPAGDDAFVAKLNQRGSQLVYSTYLGGTGFEIGFFIALDGSGSAYVTGRTGSPNFPTRPGSFQASDPDPAGEDAFVTKLNQRGSALVYSTYLGGTGVDDGTGVAVDGNGNAYLAGATAAGNFPTTPGSFQAADPDPAGQDAYVTKLNQRGSGLVYSTYLGATGFEDGAGIAIDRSGSAYVTGDTSSPNFPTTPGSFQASDPDPGDDAYVTMLNQRGSRLVYSTYLGGTGSEESWAITVDRDGSAYVAGEAESPNFPTTRGAFQAADPDPGGLDAFVTKLKPAKRGHGDDDDDDD